MQRYGAKYQYYYPYHDDYAPSTGTG
jgi:hypothetical protein